MQVQAVHGKAAFGKGTHEVHRQKTAPELDHLRTVDGRLQPGAMMECSIPIIDRSVIPAERNLQMIVFFEPYNASFDLHVESGGGRRSQSCIGPCCEAQFAEEADPWGKSRTKVKNKLPFVKAA